MTDQRAPTVNCPRCDAESAPVLYGYPTAEDMEAEGSSKVFLGGCCVEEDTEFDNSWRCLACGHFFIGETVDWVAVLGDPPIRSAQVDETEPGLR